MQPGILLDAEVDKIRNFTYSKIPDQTYFCISPITCVQVSSFISKFLPSKATGIDGLGPRIIKMAGHILSPSIALLINKCLEYGQFPSQLHYAKVFPIYKGGAKSDPSNCRPISILPTVSKIFEKHINHHLMSYLNKYKPIHETQSCFRPKHCCQTVLIKLTDHWMDCIQG